MPLFEYKAMDEDGLMVTGEFETATREQAAEHIEVDLQCTPIKIKEIKQNSVSGIFERFQRVTQQDLINYTKQFATLQKAGVPLLATLDALNEQTDNPKFKKTIERVFRDVEGGMSYSGALKKYPNVFPDIYTNTIRAGEAAGNLDEVLDNLAEQLERDEETMTKIKSALRYPVIVLTGMVLAIVVVVTWVIPQFASLFKTGNAPLPLPTQLLLDFSDFMRNNGLYIILCVIVGGVLFYRYIQTSRGRYRWDGVKLKLPVIGTLVQLMSIARFTFIFETMNKSGLPILQALQNASQAIGNEVIGRSIERVARGVEKGQGIAIPLKETKFFPPLVIQMISVGEESGALDEMLANVTEHYKNEINEITDNIMSLIEPVITVFMGVLVVILALGVFLPMWSLFDAFSG